MSDPTQKEFETARRVLEWVHALFKSKGFFGDRMVNTIWEALNEIPETAGDFRYEWDIYEEAKNE